MELDRILRDYWNCCKNNDKWYKEKQPKCIENAKKALIVVITVAIIIVVSSFFIEDPVKKAFIEIPAAGFIRVALLCAQKYINRIDASEEKKHLQDSTKGEFATIQELRLRQIESLKKILADNKISKIECDKEDVQKIQMLIELIKDRKINANWMNDG